MITLTINDGSVIRRQMFPALKAAISFAAHLNRLANLRREFLIVTVRQPNGCYYRLQSQIAVKRLSLENIPIGWHQDVFAFLQDKMTPQTARQIAGGIGLDANNSKVVGSIQELLYRKREEWDLVSCKRSRGWMFDWMVDLYGSEVA